VPAPTRTEQVKLVDKLIGKRIVIAGMTIEVIAEDGERYETRNFTTHETVFFNKPVLQNAIKLGKAEEVLSPNN
jgi:hypothetical protein